MAEGVDPDSDTLKSDLMLFPLQDKYPLSKGLIKKGKKLIIRGITQIQCFSGI